MILRRTTMDDRIRIYRQSKPYNVAGDKPTTGPFTGTWVALVYRVREATGSRTIKGIAKYWFGFALT